MAKEYDAVRLTIQYFKDFEFNVDGPNTGGHLYSDMKYCHPTEMVFAQNGRADSKGLKHLLQVHGIYCAKVDRRYAHEDILTISKAEDIAGKPGCKRVFVERAERCYHKEHENDVESNFYPSLDKPADRFLSIVEFDENGLMTLMSDYYDISPYMGPDPEHPYPTLERVKEELAFCGDVEEYMEGLEEAYIRAKHEIYGL